LNVPLLIAYPPEVELASDPDARSMIRPDTSQWLSVDGKTMTLPRAEYSMFAVMLAGFVG